VSKYEQWRRHHTLYILFQKPVGAAEQKCVYRSYLKRAAWIVELSWHTAIIWQAEPLSFGFCVCFSDRRQWFTSTGGFHYPAPPNLSTRARRFISYRWPTMALLGGAVLTLEIGKNRISSCCWRQRRPRNPSQLLSRGGIYLAKCSDMRARVLFQEWRVRPRLHGEDGEKLYISLLNFADNDCEIVISQSASA